MSTALSELFDECWPSHEFQAGCWVTNWRNNEEDHLRDVLDVVSTQGERCVLLGRLRDEHPDDRAHQERDDHRVWDALSEAAALAWAKETDGQSDARFTRVGGFPDIESSEALVEVKTVHTSDSERETVARGLKEGGGVFSRDGLMNRELPPALLKKFSDGWADAGRKFVRSDPKSQRRHIVWFRVEGIDWPLSLNEAWRQIIEWAESVSAPEDAAKVVLVERWDWRNPRWASTSC